MKKYLRIIFFLSALLVLLKYIFVWNTFGYSDNTYFKNLYLYRAEIISIYDGDTITANINLGMNIWIHNAKLRLYGINTPEIRGPERPEGIKSRNRLVQLTDQKTIFIRTHKDKTGKFGRYLAEIIIIGAYGQLININEQLVKEGYAVEYMKE